MHPGSGITPEYIEQMKFERQRLADRQVVAAQVVALLESAKLNLQSASTAGPLDAARFISKALSDYMKSQQVQVEMNMAMDAATIAKLDMFLKQLASPIVQAGPMPAGPIPNQGRR